MFKTIKENLQQKYFAVLLGVNDEQWHTVSISIPSHYKRFAFEATRGGRDIMEDRGDIAIDNIMLEVGGCKSKILPHPPKTSPSLPINPPLDAAFTGTCI